MEDGEQVAVFRNVSTMGRSDLMSGLTPIERRLFALINLLKIAYL